MKTTMHNPSNVQELSRTKHEHENTCVDNLMRPMIRHPIPTKATSTSWTDSGLLQFGSWYDQRKPPPNCWIRLHRRLAVLMQS